MQTAESDTEAWELFDFFPASDGLLRCRGPGSDFCFLKYLLNSLNSTGYVVESFGTNVSDLFYLSKKHELLWKRFQEENIFLWIFFNLGKHLLYFEPSVNIYFFVKLMSCLYDFL